MDDKLAHYLNQWHLSNPTPLAQTPTSHVYTVQSQGETLVLKCLTPLGIKDEQRGAIALHHWGGHGAVKLLRHDEGAHLLEYADGDDLVPLVQSGDDQGATHIITNVLKQLHNTKPNTSPAQLYTLKRWFRALFNRSTQGEDPIYTRGAKIAQQLLDNPQDERVLHGDIHHANIKHSTKRGWLAFDPKGVYGERTFDCANTLCNPIHMPELVTNQDRLLSNANILATELNIDLNRVLAFTFAYACLSASWTAEDGNEPTLALAVARIIEPHLKPL